MLPESALRELLPAEEEDSLLFSSDPDPLELEERELALETRDSDSSSSSELLLPLSALPSSVSLLSSLSVADDALPSVVSDVLLCCGPRFGVGADLISARTSLSSRNPPMSLRM